jgi:hypothetical protein
MCFIWLPTFPAPPHRLASPTPLAPGGGVSAYKNEYFFTTKDRNESVDVGAGGAARLVLGFEVYEDSP